MTRLLWLTDIHLNFVPRDELLQFLIRVGRTEPAAVLLTGDVAESTDVCHYLTQMAITWDCPLYFVLGNHDFYHGSIAEVRQQVRALCSEQPHLIYLTQQPGPLELAPGIGLIGHDGWADGRYGNFLGSYVRMHDHRLITELQGPDKLLLWERLKHLGDEAAAAIRTTLQQSLQQYQHTYLLTHVPPLLEACWHEGQLSDDQWSPHFTCRAMGEVILELMEQHPEHRLTVLCGHTHGSGEAHPLKNVTIYTGGAEYGRPDVVREFEV